MDKPSKADQPSEALPSPPANGAGEPITPGVFVYALTEGTTTRVNFEVVGDFDILAAPTILELAHKVARARLGLS